MIMKGLKIGFNENVNYSTCHNIRCIWCISFLLPYLFLSQKVQIWGPRMWHWSFYELWNQTIIKSNAFYQNFLFCNFLLLILRHIQFDLPQIKWMRILGNSKLKTQGHLVFLFLCKNAELSFFLIFSLLKCVAY